MHCSSVPDWLHVEAFQSCSHEFRDSFLHPLAPWSLPPPAYPHDFLDERAEGERTCAEPWRAHSMDALILCCSILFGEFGDCRPGTIAILSLRIWHMVCLRSGGETFCRVVIPPPPRNVLSFLQRILYCKVSINLSWEGSCGFLPDSIAPQKNRPIPSCDPIQQSYPGKGGPCRAQRPPARSA